jgi:predicted nucleotidyltransferase/predicted transcriptional regulator with HTH domain
VYIITLIGVIKDTVMLSLRSKVTRRILGYFFLNPDNTLYANELVRKLGLDKRNVIKKLKQLEYEGLLKASVRGNMRFYAINADYPLYQEYRRIFNKTMGLEYRLEAVAEAIPGLDKLYIFGSYAQGKMESQSDIDLLIVGDFDILACQRELNRLQKEMDREFNPVYMGKTEFDERLEKGDEFIRRVSDKPIKVKG